MRTTSPYRPRRLASLVTLLVCLVASCGALSTNTNSSEPDREQGRSSSLQEEGSAVTAVPDSPPATDDQQQASNLWEVFLQRLIDPVTWFTGGLLWLAILQYRAMRRQADYMLEGLAATQDAAKAAKKSADATLVLNQQWLITDHWRMEETEQRIDVHFALVNPTSMAVTVTYVMVRDIAPEGEAYQQESASVRVLLPHNWYGLTVTRPLQDATDRQRFADGKLRIIIIGLVGFTDAFGKDKRQPFGALCECGPNRIETTDLDASVIGQWPGEKGDDVHPQ